MRETWKLDSTAAVKSATIQIFTALVLAVWFVPTPCRAQTGDLHEDLKNLNVRLKTDHYILAGTVTDSRLEIYANALEYINKEYRKMFSEVLKEQDKQTAATKGKKSDSKSKTKTRDKAKDKAKDKQRQQEQDDSENKTMDQLENEKRFPVIVFNNKQEYERFGRAYLGGSEHTIGMYMPSNKLLIIMDQGNFNETTEVLFHEAFHQFMDSYVADPPMWLNEGLAVHFGYAKPGTNGLSFRNPPAIRWQIIRKCIQKKINPSLWEVVSADRAEFYNSMPIKVSGFENVRMSSLYYAEAYTLVHTLLADPTGRDRLRDYIRDLAKDKGMKTHEITRKYFGPDVCEHMTSFWIKHVNSRPETH